MPSPKPFNIDGGLLVDKAAGMTSAEVIRRLKRKFGIQKIGHSGTLDPMATGLLVVLCGKATRLQDLVLDGQKIYSGTIRFGIRTDSDDLTGKVIEEAQTVDYLGGRDPSELIAAVREKFLGVILQRPPIISAIKVAGERSYARARAGETVELLAREVTIFDLELNFVSLERWRYRVRCSKGTYVRSLARDIGDELGVPSTLESIRREGSGTFSVDQAVGLEQLETEDDVRHNLLQPKALVPNLRTVVVSRDVEAELRLGRQHVLRDLPLEGDLCGLESAESSLFLLVERGAEGWRIRTFLGA